MKKRQLKTKLLTGMLCIGMVSSSFLTTTAYADELTGAGISNALAQETGDVQAEPVAAGALQFAGVPVIPAETELPEEEGEHAAILAAESRLQKAENSIYNTLAVTRNENYVNIRTAADAEAEVVGKLYNNAVAHIKDTVTDEDGEDWYQIESGTVEGYTMAKYFLTGEDAEQYVTGLGNITATIKPETLRMRESADLGSKAVTTLVRGISYTVEEEGPEFTKLSVDGETVGYVHNDYIDIKAEFKEAISIEEEEALIAEREREQREAEEEAERLRLEQEEADAEDEDEAEEAEPEREADPEPAKPAKQEEREEPKPQKTEEAEEEEEAEPEETKPQKTEEAEPEEEEEDEPEETKPQKTEEAEPEDDEDEDEGSSSVSSKRWAIVDEALSYVGNLRYVYGGNSLTSGVDCSGFVQQIFKNHGVSLPRTSGEQGYSGKSVSSYKNLRPGDIIYYGGHVAIYIGDGQVVHASSPETGIRISSWNYRSPVTMRNVLGD